MDKNGYLIDLSESERTDFGRVDFAEQSEEQKVFSAIWELESEVNHGGFDYYFTYADRDAVNFAPTALRRIGASTCAGVVERALRTLSVECLPDDPGAREELIESLSDETSQELIWLDAEFLAYPDNLTELLFDHVRSHPEVFGPVVEQ